MTMLESNQSAGRRRRSTSKVASRIPAELAPRGTIAELSGIVAQQTVRHLVCELCQAPPDVRCTPDGDHLARWIGAYTAGLLSHADMAALFARVIVITKRRVVPEIAA